MADFSLGSAAYSFSSNLGSLSTGLLVTSSATANTLGSIVELIASTEAGSNSFKLTVASMNITGGNPTDFLINVLLGASGFEVMLIEGLHLSSDDAEASYTMQVFEAPLNIPAGSRISVECQSASASADGMYVYANFTVPTFEALPGYSESESIGQDTATSTSSIAVDPGATINTKGAWSEVTSTSEGFAGFLLSIGSNGNLSIDSANWMIDIGIGAAGFEEVIDADRYAASTSSEKTFQDSSFSHIKIPAGERIAIRAQSDENNSDDRLRSIVFHGVR